MTIGTNVPSRVLANDPTIDLTGSDRNLDEILSHAANARKIRPITPRATQTVVVVAVSSHVKISVIDVMTAHSDEAGMNHLRPADATVAALMKVGTIDMKTALSETNLALRGVILHRQAANHQTRMSVLQFVAGR